MTTVDLLGLTLITLNNAAALGALYAKANAEKRDLTPDEVASVRAKALAANDALQAAIDATK